MKYNYKCVVTKNGKRYYKNVNGKWKRISNAIGMKAQKGKRKYRIDTPSASLSMKKLKITKEEFDTALRKWQGKDPGFITRQLESLNRKYRKVGCDKCIQDIINVDQFRSPLFQSQSQRNTECMDCLKSISLIEPRRGEDLFPILFGSMKTSMMVDKRTKRENQEEYDSLRSEKAEKIVIAERLIKEGKREEAIPLIQQAESLDWDMRFLQIYM